MPEKEGAEEKTTKSVVNKKQKQMMGEEGYDHLRDMGRIRKNKKKKDATSYPPSDEVKKTQKVNKGPSALERVKADIEKRYGKNAIMKINKEKTVSEEGKSLLSTPGLDKLKKIKDFKSNADRVFGRKSPDLTKVAESFGGQIVGEPVELDEEPITATLGTVAAIKYGIPAAIAVGAGAYDYYKKMKGQKGIFPDLSGAVKKVGDTYNKAKDSIMQISGGTGQRKTYQRKGKSSSPDYSETSRRTGDMKGGRNNKNNKNNRVNQDTNKSFGDALKKNRNQQSGGGDNRRNQNQQSGGGNNRRNQNQQDTGGPTGGTGNRNNRNFDRRNRTYNTKDLTKELNKRKDQFNRNIFSRVKDNVKNMKNNKFVRNIIGKKKGGQLLRTGGATGAAGLGIGTALEKRRRLPRLPGLRVPDGGHVGRRTAG